MTVRRLAGAPIFRKKKLRMGRFISRHVVANRVRYITPHGDVSIGIDMRRWASQSLEIGSPQGISRSSNFHSGPHLELLNLPCHKHP